MAALLEDDVSLTNDAPARFPDGSHQGNAYQPMPGDIVSIDCKGIASKYDQHGTRIGTVKRLDYAHVEVTDGGKVVVQLPGWAHVLFLDPGWLTLVYRKAVEP